MKQNRSCMLLLLSLLVIPVLAQTPFTGLELTGQGHQELQRYFDKQAEQKVYFFEDLHASLMPGQATTGYFTQYDEIYLSEKLESIWELYSGASHATAWTTRHLDFSLMFSKASREISYPQDPDLLMDTAQIVMINLSFLKGRYNLPICFEITRVDSVEKCIEFSYLVGNAAEGKQVLEFSDDQNGGTQIHHTSFYRSHSLLRDLFIYPFFHRLITREFHRQMKKRFDKDYGVKPKSKFKDK